MCKDTRLSQLENVPKVLHSAVTGLFEAQQWQPSISAIEMGWGAPSHVDIPVNYSLKL